ncbi:MAG TPA: SDR family oxidoreductase [Capillimicrobium sp.]
MSTTAFVTGFPGFIGRRLVRRLVESDPQTRVIALAEPRMAGQARRVAADIGDRVDVVLGDITERTLGLSEADRARVTAETTHVFHLAAIYDLAVPVELAQRVNVEGTGNVLELCRACDGLQRLVYISTAYVAGLRNGVVYEHELNLGQGFKNHYESTKFQAEVWVREWVHRIPTTILRPAIVVGDSRSGETEKFDGPYYLLRSIARAESLGRPIVQFGASEAFFNVVPVDYVVSSIFAAAFAPETEGETLHLVDPQPLTTRELVTTLSREYAGREPKGKISPKLVEGSLRLPPVQKAFGGTPRESIAYLNHRVTFDTRRAVDLLGPLGLKPPRFGDYAAAMVAFFKANEDDPSFAPKRAG